MGHWRAHTKSTSPFNVLIVTGITGVNYFLKVFGINNKMLIKNSILNTFKIFLVLHIQKYIDDSIGVTSGRS